MKKLLFVLLAFLIPAAAWAQNGDALVSDMTSDHVDISARYTGDSILLFGAMSTPGQIIVKVRSPEQGIALEKKGQVGPFWLSQGKHNITGIPGLYYLLSSAPIDRILPAAARAANGLNLSDALAGMTVTPTPATSTDRQTLIDAVLKLEQSRHYYVTDPRAVKIQASRLYSTSIKLPAQLPLGKYQVDIYLVHNGQVVATQHRTIEVNEVRVEHWISSVAANRPWLFGVVFTASMMLIGLFLGVVLGRKKS
ncbi:TIGR02186 family protein [Acidihalobacter ferrooxydans]|uniref:TIGR02186 family protein n=1 Tax=Acidihalobacter ferrooxydans TaxID=1765967 RepID=A0A1P8UKH4_9GAMM|nr:TIGR02186 family protein [Acidihalobacter ferrooxydans]APZ44262.1 hypothetical protein BW247_15155 [Acidihalobacter ferrooxydans]